MDWENKVAKVIERSNKALQSVSVENTGQNLNLNHPMSMSRHPLMSLAIDDGNRIYNNVINNIDNSNSSCGPYQRAAINAYHATTKRPLSRGAVDVDRIVNDKLKTTSLAIDALRDTLNIISEEVRQLNRNSTIQERRVEVLSHNFDIRRGAMNSSGLQNL